MQVNLEKNQFLDKSILVRVTILFILVILFILLVPTRFGIIKEYLQLKSTISSVSEELVDLSKSLPTASEVYRAFDENSRFN